MERPFYGVVTCKGRSFCWAESFAIPITARLLFIQAAEQNLQLLSAA